MLGRYLLHILGTESRWKEHQVVKRSALQNMDHELNQSQRTQSLRDIINEQISISIHRHLTGPLHSLVTSFAISRVNQRLKACTHCRTLNNSSMETGPNRIDHALTKKELWEPCYRRRSYCRKLSRPNAQHCRMAHTHTITDHMNS